MSVFNVQLGKRIAEARDRAGFTQQMLARRLGLNRTSVANMEAGRQVCTAERVVDIAEALNIDAAWLLLGPRPGEPQAHIIPVDAEKRFREAVDAAIQVNLGEAWDKLEVVLRRFPVRSSDGGQS